MNGSGTKCFSFGLGPGSNFLILRNEETARERERNRYTETDRQQQKNFQEWIIKGEGWYEERNDE